MKKTMLIVSALLFVALATASAIESAEIVSRFGVQTGVLGGYQNSSNYIGGMGATLEAEFALGHDFSLSADAGGGLNVADGPLGGGGIDFKYRCLSLKQFDLCADGYGRGFYQAASDGIGYYLYGGGAILLATLKASYLTVSAGGGASYDFYGAGTGSASGALGPVGLANVAYALNKSTDLGLAFEYGADRFFLGAFVDFAVKSAPAAPKAKAAAAKGSRGKK